MRTNLHLTIQDYFRQCGINPAGAQSQINRRLPSQEAENSFSRILDGKRSSSGASQRGLTILDYLARPVAIRPQMQPIHAVQITQDGDTKLVDPMPSVDRSTVSPASLSSDPSDGTTSPRHGDAIDVKEQINISIDRAANRYHLPKALVRAVVKAESGYHVRAVSPAGAQGLMQLMPATAKELGVTDPFDIDQNIDGGAKYLRAMLDRFDGDVKLALSAYNAGPGTVTRYKGKVPYAETQNYVKRVLRFARRST